jgi:serine/threonine protein kinase
LLNSLLAGGQMPVAIGIQLDEKYRILRSLGAGGFGEVYLAEEKLLGRQVAIKVLRNRDVRGQTDLVHEMKSLNHLQHPNVVAFYHYFSEEESLFLVMEYCAGGSLRDRLQRESIPSQVVMQWGKELADTLHYIHQQDIVHHDIKPDNILFTSEEVLKIGDFGVANRNIGTFRYLAPEMLLGEVDAKDVRIPPVFHGSVRRQQRRAIEWRTALVPP